MKNLRKSPDKVAVKSLSDDLKRSEYALFDGLRDPGIMTVKTQGKLVVMAQRLRRLRYEIEAEAGI